MPNVFIPDRANRRLAVMKKQDDNKPTRTRRTLRFLKKLSLIFILAVGVYKGADAAAPGPQLTPVFNNAVALPASQKDAPEYRLPSLQEPDEESKKTLWRVRVGAWEIGAGGHHTFLEFSPYSQNDADKLARRDVYQLHGIACDEVRHTWAQLNYKHSEAYTQYLAGDYVLKGLGVNQDHHRRYFSQQSVAYVDVFYGTKEEVLKKYLDGMQVAKQINSTNDPYILLRHNSNSAQNTYREALGLPATPLFVAHRALALGGRIWAPGINASLLPKDWDAKKLRAQSDYKDFTAEQLERRARELSGEDKMFATFRTPKPPGMK